MFDHMITSGNFRFDSQLGSVFLMKFLLQISLYRVREKVYRMSKAFSITASFCRSDTSVISLVTQVDER